MRWGKKALPPQPEHSAIKKVFRFALFPRRFWTDDETKQVWVWLEYYVARYQWDDEESFWWFLGRYVK